MWNVGAENQKAIKLGGAKLLLLHRLPRKDRSRPHESREQTYGYTMRSTLAEKQCEYRTDSEKDPEWNLSLKVLVLLFGDHDTTPMNAPEKAPRNIARNASRHPSSAPTPSIIFTSPKPIASTPASFSRSHRPAKVIRRRRAPQQPLRTDETSHSRLTRHDDKRRRMSCR